MAKKKISFLVPVEIAVRVELEFEAGEGLSEKVVREKAAKAFLQWAAEGGDSLSLGEDSENFMERVRCSLFEAALSDDQVESGVQDLMMENSEIFDADG